MYIYRDTCVVQILRKGGASRLNSLSLSLPVYKAERDGYKMPRRRGESYPPRALYNVCSSSKSRDLLGSPRHCEKRAGRILGAVYIWYRLFPACHAVSRFLTFDVRAVRARFFRNSKVILMEREFG